MQIQLGLLSLVTLVSPSPNPIPAAGPDPDVPFSPIQDPEDPDFNGVVDFSNAKPGPDGSWCITKVKYVDHMENDQVKECWHQNVTQCHDTYITEFLPSQEQKCEETFWKSCKIDFKEVPFNYSLKQCHTPLIKKCDDYSQDAYGAPQKTVCRTWFESECNTTYIESPSGDHKPNTWCQKVPKKICAPDSCNMVQGPEDCRDKTMVSTIQKPMEHCELQPQRHCSLITKLVPHLTTREVCKVIPKEICVLKLVNPHPVKKPITLKWCTKKKPPNLPSYSPPKSASNSYLPPKSAPKYQPSPFSNQLRREGATGTGTQEDPFIITVDGENFADLNHQDFNSILSSGPLGPIRNPRNPGDSPDKFNIIPSKPVSVPYHHQVPGPHQPHHGPPPRAPTHKRHAHPGPRSRHEILETAGSDVSVHVVTPEPVATTTPEPLHIVKPMSTSSTSSTASGHSKTPTPKTANDKKPRQPKSIHHSSIPHIRGSSLRNYPGSIF